MCDEPAVVTGDLIERSATPRASLRHSALSQQSPRVWMTD
jgi:hypothetical protein